MILPVIPVFLLHTKHLWSITGLSFLATCSSECSPCCWLTLFLCPTSRPDVALLWFLIPLKAAKHLVCDQYRWLTIKIVTALLLLAILALFLYNMPGYMVKKMLGAWGICRRRQLLSYRLSALMEERKKIILICGLCSFSIVTVICSTENIDLCVDLL